MPNLRGTLKSEGVLAELGPDNDVKVKGKNNKYSWTKQELYGGSQVFRHRFQEHKAMKDLLLKGRANDHRPARRDHDTQTQFLEDVNVQERFRRGQLATVIAPPSKSASRTHFHSNISLPTAPWATDQYHSDNCGTSAGLVIKAPNAHYCSLVFFSTIKGGAVKLSTRRKHAFTRYEKLKKFTSTSIPPNIMEENLHNGKGRAS